MEKKRDLLALLTGIFTGDTLIFALMRILAGMVMGTTLIFAPAKPLLILEFFAWLLVPAFFLPVRKIRSWQCYTAAAFALIFALILWRKLWAAPSAGAAVWMIFSAYSAFVHGRKTEKFGIKLLEFGVALLECAIAFFYVYRALFSDQPDLPLLFGFGITAASLFAAGRLFRKK